MPTTHKTGTVLTVYLGPEDGSEVKGNTDRNVAYRPTQILRAAGAAQLDYAEFEYEYERDGIRIENITTPAEWNRQIEIRINDDNGSFTPVFWGDLDVQLLTMQTAKVTAAIRPYHFGGILEGPVFYDVRNEEWDTVYEDVLFNPLLDGRIENNMSSQVDERDNYQVWGDPDSFATTAAQTYQGNTLSEWTLDEAVNAICWVCNPDEEFIDNPDVRANTIFDDTPAIQNVRLKRGRYLPDYLDQLLIPYGFNWYVKLSDNGDGTTKKQITVFKDGEGTEKAVKLQAFDETLNFDDTECSSFQVTTDVSQAANKVIVEGSRKEVEVTIELVRGWANADDSISASDLQISDPDSDYSSKPLVWRYWPANEAGDQIGVRTELTTPLLDQATSDAWETELGIELERRRRIGDCLALDEKGKRRPPYLEWSDDDGDTWKPVPPDWSYVILDSEIGILFAADTPPEDLVAAGDDARLRVTGTVALDERLRSVKEIQIASPNGRENTLHLDASDRFHYRHVLNTGTFQSSLAGETADTADDTTALGTYARDVQIFSESAGMQGELVLNTLDTSYEIGELITKLEGREIAFNRNADGDFAKYLQITGIEYDEQQQLTRLVTEPAEAEPFFEIQSDGRDV